MITKNSKTFMKFSGFSLIELMITVAIVSILAAVAYPSYVDSMARSNRAEAKRELLRIANLQEQFFMDNRTYTADMTDLGLAADPFVTTLDNGVSNYSIDATIPALPATTFLLRADAINAQAANDGDCSWLAIDETGRKTAENATCWEQ
jgi:type IV pilus assembly protein PilE